LFQQHPIWTQKLRSFCGLFFELLGLGFSGLAWRQGNLWSFRSLFWVKKMVAQRFRAEMEIGDPLSPKTTFFTCKVASKSTQSLTFQLALTNFGRTRWHLFGGCL
jgi:hypothetical protein